MKKKRFDTVSRQEQIAEAALDIVRSKGVRALSVAAVSQKVGIVPSAIYRHFKKKSEIVAAVLLLIQARLQAHFEEVVNMDADPVEKLHLLLNRHVETIAGNNAIPRIIFSEEVISGAPEKRQQLYDIIQGVLANVATIVHEGQAKMSIRKDLPAENIAISFIGIIQPAAILWSLSAGEFDLLKHCQKAWRLFADAIQIKV